MADDENKVEEAKEEAESAAEKAEEAAEKAEESAQKAEEAAKEVTVEEKKEVKTKDVKVSKKLESIISEIEKLSVLDLSELVHALEEKFGVSAQAAVAIAPAGAQANGQAGDGASEQTSFNVILADGGANKISVIKAVREIVPTLGLKEAKDLVDSAPKPVVEGVNKETANEAKTKLETAGAKVELK